MKAKIIKVEHIGDYRLRLTFTTGESGVLDLADQVIGRGGLFAPLQDVNYFAQVQIEPDFKTLVWPNDLDFDPDVLYDWAIKEPAIVPT